MNDLVNQIILSGTFSSTWYYHSGSFQYTFFYKKKVYKKMRLKSSKSEESLKQITRLNLQTLVFLLAKNRYFVVTAFKLLKMELKFKYTILLTGV